MTTTNWGPTVLLVGLDASGQYQAVAGITSTEARKLYSIAWKRLGAPDFDAPGNRQSRGFFHNRDTTVLPGNAGAYESALLDLAAIRS
jgi:hypothetical protein